MKIKNSEIYILLQNNIDFYTPEEFKRRMEKIHNFKFLVSTK